MGTLKDYDVTELLPTIDVPALIFSGGNDLCTPYIAKTMFDRIPNARWELFRDCRHMCFAEDHPNYMRMMKEWLSEND
jgi:proline iminopeptidase